MPSDVAKFIRIVDSNGSEDEKQYEGIKRNFTVSLLYLALDKTTQIEYLPPGSCPCHELYQDFINDAQFYLERFEKELSSDQIKIITGIADYLEGIPNEDFICFNSEVLARDSWNTVRHLARMALPAFGLTLENAPAYKEIEPGIWQRK